MDNQFFDMIKNDNPSRNNQFEELKNEIQELRKENFQLKLKLESQSEVI